MATKTVYASRSLYVSSATPTVSHVTEFLNCSTTDIPYIYFDMSEIPKYANALLRIYAHDDAYIQRMYSLNAPFSETTTNYNNRPERTQIRLFTPELNEYNTYIEIALTPADVSAMSNGISFSNTRASIYRSHRASTGKPHIICDWEENTSTLKAAVTNNNIDEGVVVEWEEIVNQTGAKVSVYDSNNVLITSKEISGTALSITFTPGDIRVLNARFEVEVWETGKVYKDTVESALTKVEPTIIALEPDNVPQNVNKQINISWTTKNQQSYKLLLDGITYSGTSATGLLLPANTLTSGNKTMTLTTTYISSWGEVRTATKTVNFLAYGNPPNPTLDGTTVYNNALPIYTWTSSEQVAYELKIRNIDNQDVETSGEVISASTQYASTIALENSSTYTVLLRIKNQYNLWSDWVSKVFTTSFVVPNKPTLTLVATNNSSIIVSLNVEYSSEFSKAEIWRKTDNSEWIRIAYNLDNTFSYEDKFVGNETYYYKVRAIGVSGGISESDTLSETLGNLSPIKDFHLTNVENFNDNVVLIGNPSVRLTNNRKIVSTVFAGSKAPKIEKGETNYKSMSLSFAVEESTYEKLMDVVDNSDVLLYRDGRGRKFYCQINSYPVVNYESGGYLSISFSIVEVAFVEGDFYSGRGNQPSLFFDGTWFFDGTRVLNGEV